MVVAQELKMTNIQKSYGSRHILRGISLNILTGEVVSLLGPNGAGKTTCFYCITGLINPDAGNIKLNDENITNLPFYMRARKGIGYLPQEVSIFKSLTVENNIMAVLEITEPYLDKRLNRLEELLTEFSIIHLRNEPSIALSGGERRRLEIARCLASNPKFILLDEPFAGIDPISIQNIKDTIIYLKNKGYGVLITDHNVHDTLGISDRAYVVYDGHVLHEGSSDEIISNNDVRKIYLGEKFRL